MKITFEKPTNAPGCFLIRAEDGRTELIQSDWDFPSLAQTFGWSLSMVQIPKRGREMCFHGSTDGTIKCSECDVGASRFITAAKRWLYDNS